MKNKRVIVIIVASFFLVSFLLIDLKNYYYYGAPYITSDDTLDHVKSYLTTPGMIVSFIIVLLIYRNIHDYNYYVVETVALLTSSILYGWLAAILVMRRSKHKKNIRKN